MPRGYRGIFIAFAGLTLIGANSPSQNRSGNPAAAYADQESRNHEKIAAGISRISDALVAEKDSSDPYQEERNKREIRDLQAQENSAYWAAAMFWATLFAILMSIIGIGLVWTTFRETRKANEIASKNIEAYQRREAGSLYPKFTYNKPELETGQFRLELINPGPTRVQIIHKQLHTDFTHIGENIVVPIDGTQTGEMILIEAGKSYMFPNNSLVGEPEKMQILGGAIYADIFGRISLCRVAIIIDQETRKCTTNENADFGEWVEIASKQGS
jgi:hypothetical protein